MVNTYHYAILLFFFFLVDGEESVLFDSSTRGLKTNCFSHVAFLFPPFLESVLFDSSTRLKNKLFFPCGILVPPFFSPQVFLGFNYALKLEHVLFCFSLNHWDSNLKRESKTVVPKVQQRNHHLPKVLQSLYPVRRNPQPLGPPDLLLLFPPMLHPLQTTLMMKTMISAQSTLTWTWWKTRWSLSGHSRDCQDQPRISSRVWVLFCQRTRTTPHIDCNIGQDGKGKKMIMVTSVLSASSRNDPQAPQDMAFWCLLATSTRLRVNCHPAIYSECIEVGLSFCNLYGLKFVKLLKL